MKNLIFLVLLLGGIAVLLYVLGAANLLGADFSRVFTVAQTNETTRLLIVGLMGAALGAIGLIHPAKSHWARSKS